MKFFIHPSFFRLTFLVILLSFAGLSPAPAQFPGMEPESPKPTATAGEPGPTEPQRGQVPDAAEPDTNPLEMQWKRFMGPDSPYRSLILVVLTLLVLMNLKAYLSRLMKRTLKKNAYFPENADAFLKIWNSLWKFVIAVLVIMAMTGSLRLLGLTAGFFGMMLGWSLQQPVTGIAAWLMIILKKPFKVGDRVVIAGITGDITGISLTHVILNQVGGSVSGEERSGRGILIPNAILFQHVIINYTLDQEHMLDEVPVRLTFDSDWEKAKEIMIEAAEDVTADIIAKTGQEPFIRAEFLDWGILVRLRYQTIPAKRQELSTYIIERLLKEFRKEYPRVRFATPSQTIRHRPDVDIDSPEFKNPGSAGPHKSPSNDGVEI